MNPAQLLLRYQAQVERERALRDVIARLESRLQADPEVVSLEEALQEARAAQAAVAARLRESDHAREDHRSKLRSREKELMSGRIRNPTELMQMSTEVAHMKARFAEEGASFGVTPARLGIVYPPSATGRLVAATNRTSTGATLRAMPQWATTNLRCQG